MKLVEPRDASPQEAVLQELTSRGVPLSDAAWLSAFLVSVSYAGSSAAGQPGYDEQRLLDRLEKPVRVIGDLFARAGNDRNKAVLWTLATLPGVSPRYMLDDSAVRLDAAGSLTWRSKARNQYLQNQARLRVRAAIVLALVRHALQQCERVDFNEALRDLPLDVRPDGPAHPISLIAGRLLLADRIDPIEHIDFDRVTKAQYIHSDHDAHGDPRRLEFWFDLSTRQWEYLWPCPRRRFRQSLWPWIAQLFARTDSTVLGGLALSTWRSYRRWLWFRTRNELLLPRKSWMFQYDETQLHPRAERDVLAANELSAGIAKCADVLVSRLPEVEQDWQVAAATAGYCFRAYFQRSKDFSPESRAATDAAATEFVGRMRSLLASPAENADEFRSRTDAYTWTLQYLAGLKSIWAATKPMILALRSLPTPAVAPDLRYWNVPDSPAPPRPWAWIAETLSAIPHTFAKLVERKDPQLLSFKAELAGFFLDRLKSRKDQGAPDGAAQMVEPDATWRYAYVRAFDELGVNPKGRAEKLLKWSAQHDADSQVRKAASDAVSGLNARAQSKGQSHRRGVFAAFWWLRQAHFISLGGELDTAGAQRTFRREVQRTNEGRVKAQDN